VEAIALMWVVDLHPEEDVEEICCMEDVCLELPKGLNEVRGMYETRKKRATGEVSTQTERIITTSAATDAPPTPPTRTYAAAAVQTPLVQYAAAAVQTLPVQRKQGRQATPQRTSSRHGAAQATPPTQRQEQQAKRGQDRPTEKPNLERPPTTRALVMHAAPLKAPTPETTDHTSSCKEDISSLHFSYLFHTLS